MSRRYEFDTADCPLEIVPPGADLGEDDLAPGIYGLVIGDPWASAFVVEGTPPDLRRFVQRIGDAVQRDLPA
ncbi:hypothetical protein [Kutzneria buriramensis]|uniref:Uncharacterized protein n=1 Tax=Kutzneria buriramensis TaxID=1045776 RepID=A0A3E0GY25_9PSEU|nr:hypothetical protein [Kutzneria buriramensis]REH31174.1 hypothetical protein BCF44_122197 [Kutzneria buriramensis]